MKNMRNGQQDFDQCVAWAKNLKGRQDWVLLDTETTGLDDKAEIIQIGVTDCAGKPILDNILLKPVRSIPPAATKIHGITNYMVEESLTFKQVWPQLLSILRNFEVVIYNAAYDTKLIKQTANLYKLTVPPYHYSCAMLQYAVYKGEWNDYRNNYAWQKLKGGDHSAVGDCLATLTALKEM